MPLVVDDGQAVSASVAESPLAEPMWSIANTTPYLAGVEILRDRHGAEILVAVVKATFSILPDGRTQPAKQKVDIVRVPSYVGPAARSSLIADSEFVPNKPTTDVLVSGHAYAPAQTRARSIDVRVQVGGIDKRLRVWGDRRCERRTFGRGATDPLPFERMPITYERAYGGAHGEPGSDGVWQCDPRNPAGRGFGLGGEPKDGDLLPNIEYPDVPEKPAGFGPIARHWSPRRELGGTYDDAWQQNRHPLVPDDFSDSFYQSAPSDQQSEAPLRGGEPVTLENLTPTGLLSFSLPRVWLLFHTQFGGDVEAHRGQLHTVSIEADVPRLIMTWSSTLRCQGRTMKIRRIHIREKQWVTLSAAVGRGR